MTDYLVNRLSVIDDCWWHWPRTPTVGLCAAPWHEPLRSVQNRDYFEVHDTMSRVVDHHDLFRMSARLHLQHGPEWQNAWTQYYESGPIQGVLKKGLPGMDAAGQASLGHEFPWQKWRLTPRVRPLRRIFVAFLNSESHHSSAKKLLTDWRNWISGWWLFLDSTIFSVGSPLDLRLGY